MAVSEQLVQDVVKEVVAKLQIKADVGNNLGVYGTMEEAIEAAKQAQKKVRTMSMDQREKIISIIRRKTKENAEIIARMGVEETGMGNVGHKILKHHLVAERTPGTEDITTTAWSGDRGLTLVEMGPFGVIGAITPCTNPSETVICNTIGMLAGGNTVVFNPHPAAIKTSIFAINMLNQASVEAGGPDAIACTVEKPTLESSNIMMKHKDDYAVAVRKPDGEIVVQKETYKSIVYRWKKLTEIPFIRGVFNFIDSMVLGMKTLTYSASFYEEEEEKEKELTKEETSKKEKKESLLMGVTVAFSLVAAVAIFMVLPYFLSSLLKRYIPSYGVRTVIEGFVRIGIFILYVLLISRMEDIQRTFMYHGAEHKCINCIEHGLPLTVENVRSSSRQHKRCGTSFLFLVLAISIIMLLLVRAETPLMRIVIRIVLLPVIAGVSYELLKLAGRSDNLVVNLFSKPGLAIQKLTTKEPDDGMIEVAIQAVEAVFDWRTYEAENFHTAADH